jgi:hypothetical protein
MESKYSYIYEGYLNEGFERSIMSGHLTEAKVTEMYYNGELSDSQKLVAEGFFDRPKSKAVGAVGSVKGAANQGMGALQQMAGNRQVNNVNKKMQEFDDYGYSPDPNKPNNAMNRATATQQQGADRIAAGKTQGYNAKYTSYMNSAAGSIVNDLKKLGIAVADPQQLLQDLNGVLARHTQGPGSQAQGNQGQFNMGQASDNSFAQQRDKGTTRRMRPLQ